MGFSTLTIGRGKRADIIVEHETISRLHLEVTLTDQNRLYIVDRASKWGVWCWCNEEWQRIVQGYVNKDDIIALGKHKIEISELLPQIKARVSPQKIKTDEPLSVKPRRSLTTGEIEIR